MLSPPTSILQGHDAVTLEQAIGLLAVGADLAAGRAIDGPRTDESLGARLQRVHADPAIAADIAATLGLPASIEAALRAGQGDAAISPSSAFLPVSASLTLVADVAELALPWLAGHARRVALVAQDAAGLTGLAMEEQRLLVRAALLHGVGRAGVPVAVWARRGKLPASERDAVRRAPYWTARVGAAIDGLDLEAQLASQVYERLDGSGYYRGLDAQSLGMPQRLLAASAAWVALCSPRPWRAAHEAAAARALLAAQVSGGRLDADAVDAVCTAARGLSPAAPATGPLSTRETDILRRISQGDSVRDTARALRLSSAAIHTHLDHILSTLGCATLRAATLRALTLHLV